MDITGHIIECIENSKPVSFLKFGDGEFNCMRRHNGSNCDGDIYTYKLSNGLIASFKFIVENTNNSYIGAWHTDDVKCYCESLVNKPINWCKYHTIIFDKNNGLCIIQYNLIEEISSFFSLEESDSKEVIGRWVKNTLQMRVRNTLSFDLSAFPVVGNT